MIRVSLLSLVIALSTACIPVTVNLTFAFPPKEMEEKLIEMEKKVREEPKKEAAAFDPVLAYEEDGTLVDVCFQDSKINVTVETPAIKEINKRRNERFGELKPHFVAGHIGEGNDARVHEREAGSLGGKEKAALRKLITEENKDREGLLLEILKANKLPNDQLDEVQHVYARALLERAEVGWWIQTPKKGTWRKKTEEDKRKLERREELDE